MNAARCLKSAPTLRSSCRATMSCRPCDVPAAAERQRPNACLARLLRESDVPENVTLDKSGANNAAIAEIHASKNIPIVIRQVKYLNNLVEQDHRTIRRNRPVCGFHEKNRTCFLFQIVRTVIARSGAVTAGRTRWPYRRHAGE